ncbi:hypothetical protein EC988_003683, partial [Linderina pennispora]
SLATNKDALDRIAKELNEMKVSELSAEEAQRSSRMARETLDRVIATPAQVDTGAPLRTATDGQPWSPHALPFAAADEGESADPLRTPIRSPTQNSHYPHTQVRTLTRRSVRPTRRQSLVPDSEIANLELMATGDAGNKVSKPSAATAFIQARRRRALVSEALTGNARSAAVVLIAKTPKSARYLAMDGEESIVPEPLLMPNMERYVEAFGRLNPDGGETVGTDLESDYDEASDSEQAVEETEADDAQWPQVEPVSDYEDDEEEKPSTEWETETEEESDEEQSAESESGEEQEEGQKKTAENDGDKEPVDGGSAKDTAAPAVPSPKGFMAGSEKRFMLPVSAPALAVAPKTVAFSSPVPNVPAGTFWQCKKCSMSNTGPWGKCSRCNAPKPSATSEAKSEEPKLAVKADTADATERAFSPLSVSGFKVAAVEDGKWKCSTCDLLSPNSASKCTVCEAPKPGAVADEATKASTPAMPSFGSFKPTGGLQFGTSSTSVFQATLSDTGGFKRSFPGFVPPGAEKPAAGQDVTSLAGMATGTGVGVPGSSGAGISTPLFRGFVPPGAEKAAAEKGSKDTTAPHENKAADADAGVLGSSGAGISTPLFRGFVPPSAEKPTIKEDSKDAGAPHEGKTADTDADVLEVGGEVDQEKESHGSESGSDDFAHVSQQTESQAEDIADEPAESDGEGSKQGSASRPAPTKDVQMSPALAESAPLDTDYDRVSQGKVAQAGLDRVEVPSAAIAVESARVEDIVKSALAVGSDAQNEHTDTPATSPIVEKAKVGDIAELALPASKGEPALGVSESTEAQLDADYDKISTPNESLTAEQQKVAEGSCLDQVAPEETRAVDAIAGALVEDVVESALRSAADVGSEDEAAAVFEQAAAEVAGQPGANDSICTEVDVTTSEDAAQLADVAESKTESEAKEDTKGTDSTASDNESDDFIHVSQQAESQIEGIADRMAPDVSGAIQTVAATTGSSAADVSGESSAEQANGLSELERVDVGQLVRGASVEDIVAAAVPALIGSSSALEAPEHARQQVGSAAMEDIVGSGTTNVLGAASVENDAAEQPMSHIATEADVDESQPSDDFEFLSHPDSFDVTGRISQADLRAESAPAALFGMDAISSSLDDAAANIVSDA